MCEIVVIWWFYTFLCCCCHCCSVLWMLGLVAGGEKFQLRKTVENLLCISVPKRCHIHHIHTKTHIHFTFPFLGPSQDPILFSSPYDRNGRAKKERVNESGTRNSSCNIWSRKKKYFIIRGKKTVEASGFWHVTTWKWEKLQFVWTVNLIATFYG